MTEHFREVFYGELSFLVFNCVYEPAEDTFLLARNLVVYGGERVLDLGTGCGILAVLAAFKASYVLAVDINPCAVRCARENARRNGVLEKIDFICGNLFDPLRTHSSFDLILFNAPYLPVEEEPKSWAEYAWSGGRDGRRVIDSFLERFIEHLKPGGRLLLVQSSLSGIERTMSTLMDKGCKAEIVDTIKSFFETIALIKAVKVQR
ncbi:MAG: class I SAM-dependent methyltransferase [Candidatus Bathyarchaeota archaeon]|nr:class I SAM-dependent methyltransferase [Candidatus Bathyarchaeota archaeon]